MFHVRHQFRFNVAKNRHNSSWLNALQVLSSKQNETVHHRNNVILFNNLIRFGYENKNMHLICNLQQALHSRHLSLNEIGLRSALSILEKWDSKEFLSASDDKLKFAFWVCQHVPLVDDDEGGKSENNNNNNNSNALFHAKQLSKASVVSRLVDFFVRFDFASSSSEQRKNGFVADEENTAEKPNRELIRLFAHSRALGIVETNSSMVAMYLKLARSFSSKNANDDHLPSLQREATRLFETIPLQQRTTTMFNDYSALLSTINNKNDIPRRAAGASKIRQILELSRSRHRPHHPTIVVILDTNMLIFSILKNQAINSIIRRSLQDETNTNQDDNNNLSTSQKLFQALFNGNKSSYGGSNGTSSKFIFVVSHVVYQESIAWFRRNDNQVVKFQFNEENHPTSKNKQQNVDVRISGASCLESLEMMRGRNQSKFTDDNCDENVLWVWLSSEESVVARKIEQDIPKGNSINDLNDDSVVQLASDIAFDVVKDNERKASVILATRDKLMISKVTSILEGSIGVWP